MGWSTAYIVYRLGDTGQLSEVYQTSDMKQVKYWMQYIAKPGDLCCRTPLHPKHSQKGPSPEYFSHKEQSGTPSTDQEGWKKFAVQKKFDEKFPTEQIGAAEQNAQS